MTPLPPRSALFPYTTLFRSRKSDSNVWLSMSTAAPAGTSAAPPRSEEHTSELQSRLHLVCLLLLEKKNSNIHAEPPDPRRPDIRTHIDPRRSSTLRRQRQPE